MTRRSRPTPDDRETELLALGLTRYQAAAYARLSELGPAGPRQIAEAAHVPLARAYEALADLVAQGLAEALPGPTKTFRAMPVETALDREIARLQAAAASLASEADSLRAEFATPELPDAGFLLHPGPGRFAAVAAALGATGRPLSAVLLVSTAAQVLGGLPALARGRWERLVLVGTPEEASAVRALAWEGAPPRFLPLGSVTVERLTDGHDVVLRAAAGAGYAVALASSDTAFVHDALERIREAWDAAASAPEAPAPQARPTEGRS